MLWAFHLLSQSLVEGAEQCGEVLSECVLLTRV